MWKRRHPSKALNPMLITEGGISIDMSAEHSLNAYFSIVFNDDWSSNKTFFNDLHPLKAYCLIFVTEEGIGIHIRFEHSPKA